MNESACINCTQKAQFDNLSAITIIDQPPSFDIPEEINIGELMEQAFENNIKGVKALEAVVAQHPNSAHLAYCLFVAKAANSENDSLNVSLAKELYEKYPDQAFLKTNYARASLFAHQFEEIPKIFNNCFTINAAFPTQQAFSAEEVIEFYSLIADYFCELNDFSSVFKIMKFLSSIEGTNENSHVLMVKEKIMRTFADALGMADELADLENEDMDFDEDTEDDEALFSDDGDDDCCAIKPSKGKQKQVSCKKN